ncbi:hypothetical protein M404DRAFT_854477 [Pisolithus tinctorius Marx 270]|uniref:Uncharacterized protein n=1 Tax=Pisolithus tinctorius Marx 270 TaxID=870435 RepID=A0A0C3JL30_PISTI|nr:hypothetical protein M404DRAFT_854477 [Pisolithus tinctorius Marx 270]
MRASPAHMKIHRKIILNNYVLPICGTFLDETSDIRLYCRVTDDSTVRPNDCMTARPLNCMTAVSGVVLPNVLCNFEIRAARPHAGLKISTVRKAIVQLFIP